MESDTEERSQRFNRWTNTMEISARTISFKWTFNLCLQSFASVVVKQTDFCKNAIKQAALGK